MCGMKKIPHMFVALVAVCAAFFGSLVPADAAPALPRLALDLRDAAGRRVSVRVRLVEKASGKILAEGETRDASSDFNRHFSAALPAGTEVELFWEDSGVFRRLGESVVPEHASVLTLALPPSFCFFK